MSYIAVPDAPAVAVEPPAYSTIKPRVSFRQSDLTGGLSDLNKQIGKAMEVLGKHYSDAENKHADLLELADEGRATMCDIDNAAELLGKIEGACKAFEAFVMRPVRRAS